MTKRLFPLVFIPLFLTACQSFEGGAQESSFTNHLLNESSPYLLQHAHNPVDWHPWGEEALAKAGREDKMLIISIGYAACHWCHVMERESFEDTAVARLMNEHFVSIKVDREERPDVDDIYMTACQMATGEPCGWPLNAFALADGRPVWAGTYFPKKQWIEILNYFADLKENEAAKLEDFAGRFLSGLSQDDLAGLPAPDNRDFRLELIRPLVEAGYETFDFQWGGTKGAPKFPMPRAQEFLLYYHHLTKEERALEAVSVTLDNLAKGALFDHLGGGFARYATDARWRLPHFEKMLYDNAQLVSLFAHAYQVTKNPLYRKVVEETLSFIRREMTSPEGGFYSSLDADSEGEEGKFYVWKKAEIDSVLRHEQLAELFTAHFNVTEQGNWEAGKNTLYTEADLQHTAVRLGLTADLAQARLEKARKLLFEAREDRVRPALDDKMLTSWNALMLEGYLDAYHALGDSAYLKAALRNARFIVQKMMQSDYRLNRNYKSGRSVINAFLDDYALTAKAFIALYQATFDEQWLSRARGLADYALAHFFDDASGLFFYTSDLDPPLVTRKRELTDNVIPGSNSTMASVLFELGELFYHEPYLEKSRKMLRQMAGVMLGSTDPAFYANWNILYLTQAQQIYEIAIVGTDCAIKRQELMRMYLPDALVLGGAEEGDLELLKGKLQEGKTMIYVCRNKICKFPVLEAEEALKLMGR